MADVGRLQLRRDTAANLAATDPVLLPGEPVYVIDTGVLKFGNGTSKFSQLNGIGAGGTAVADASTSSKGVIQLAGDLLGTAAAPTVKTASTTNAGKVELATDDEANTGTDTERAVTPAALKFATTNALNAKTYTSGSITDFGEAVDDRLAATLKVNSPLTLTYDDTNNKLTLGLSAYTGDYQFEAVRTTGSAAAPSATANTWSTVPLDSVTLNVGGWTWDAANSLATVPAGGGGLYLLSGSVRIADGAPGARSVGLGIGTSNGDGGHIRWIQMGSQARQAEKFFRITRLAAGDKLRLYLYSETSAFPYFWNASLATGIFMTAVRLAP